MFEKFFEHSPDALVIVNDGGTIDRVNLQAEAMFRLPREQLVGQTMEALLPERFLDLHSTHRANYMRHPKSRPMGTGLQLFARRADGLEFPVDVMLIPVEVGDRKVVITVVRDITDCKRLEHERDEAEKKLRLAVDHCRELSLTLEQRVEERTREVVKGNRELDETNRMLREANKVFRAMYERGGIYMVHLDLKGVIVDANPACVEELGFARADIIGKRFWEAGWWNISQDVANWIRDRVERAIAGERTRGEVSYLVGDGEERVTEIAMIPIEDDAGRVGSLVAIGIDVTERARRYRATFENAAVGMAYISADLKLVTVNEAVCGILGYPARELLGKSMLDVTHPDDLGVTVAATDRIRAREIDDYDVEKRYLRKDGSAVWARESVGCARKGDGSVDYFVAGILNISRRKHAEEELNKSEERFKIAVLRAPIPLLLFDDREQILALSARWLQESGYSRDELHTLGDWTARAYGERAGEVLEYLRDMIASGRGVVRRVQQMVRTHGGLRREWSFVASSLGSLSDGRRLFMAAAQDTTERKAHEEQIEMLMREARHRTKNILGIVQSVARQTVAHDPEQFLETFSERIQALAANQDLLVKSQWQGADVEDLVRAQLAHFTDLVGSRIAVHGPKLRVNAAAAQAIGLAVHELATNAGKYGALSTDGGHVDVDWRSDAHRFAISWIERGGPCVQPPDHRGFGSMVIDSVAKRAVGGEVALDYAPAGFKWHLTCPKVNALEPAGG